MGGTVSIVLISGLDVFRILVFGWVTDLLGTDHNTMALFPHRQEHIGMTAARSTVSFPGRAEPLRAFSVLHTLGRDECVWSLDPL